MILFHRAYIRILKHFCRIGIILENSNMSHNYNKLNIKPGDIVILDAGFSNSEEVKVVSLTPSGLFTTVCEPDDQRMPWEVMTSRLIPKQTEESNVPPECKECGHKNSENCNTCDILNPQFR